MEFQPRIGHCFDPQTLAGVRCPACGGELFASRTCFEVNLCCKSCGAKFGLKDIAGQLDDAAEEALAFVPLDRL